MSLVSHDILIFAGLGASLAMAGLWLVQRWRGDASFVDVAWAGGIGVLAIAYASWGDGYPARRVIVGVLGLAGPCGSPTICWSIGC